MAAFKNNVGTKIQIRSASYLAPCISVTGRASAASNLCLGLSMFMGSVMLFIAVLSCAIRAMSDESLSSSIREVLVLQPGENKARPLVHTTAAVVKMLFRTLSRRHQRGIRTHSQTVQRWVGNCFVSLSWFNQFLQVILLAPLSVPHLGFRPTTILTLKFSWREYSLFANRR